MKTYVFDVIEEPRCPSDTTRFFDGAKCVGDTCPIAICGRDYQKVSVREEMISRRMRMIDARRVIRSIHRWLLSHLTVLYAIAPANTSTRADRKQYRALETLIPNITFRSFANEREEFL